MHAIMRDAVLNNFVTQIRLNLSNGLGYFNLKGIGRLRFIDIDLRVQETSPVGLIGTILVANLRHLCER